MIKRLWVIFKEDIEKAFLLENVPTEVTNEEVKKVCETSYRTVYKIIAVDPADEVHCFTNTNVVEWDYLVG